MMLTDPWFADSLGLLLAAEGAPAAHTSGADAASQIAGAGGTGLLLFVVVRLGVLTIGVGIILCLYRMLRGPHLADRVLAGDVLSMHVVAMVVLLAIYMGTTVFFDAALVVAIIGFASTLAFAQYIGARRGGGTTP